MNTYEFNFLNKNYELSEENLQEFINCEENVILGIVPSDVLSLLNESSEVNFDKAYYEEPCQSCKAGKTEKVKYFEFLEFYFYIFTKDNNYVISTLSKAYEGTSYNKLLKEGKADNSYIVSIIVCKHCGDYSIQIEQCEV